MEAAQEESSSDTLQSSDLFGIKHIANVPREYKNVRGKKRKGSWRLQIIRARKDKTTWARRRGVRMLKMKAVASSLEEAVSQNTGNFEKSNF